MEQYTTTTPKSLDELSKDALTIKYQRDPLLERAVNSINRLATTVEDQRRHIAQLEAQLTELRSYVQTIKK